ncbi:MAG: restriction endonuclease subunit S [Treponema sp.]|nr:restriction endonuclease subunit S [Treponema sp.]
MAIDWKKVKLGDLATTIQPGPFGSQLHSSDYSDEGTPIIMPKDMIDGKVKLDSLARVPEKHLQRLVRHQVFDGDLMVARKGDVRKCIIITKGENGWLTGSDCLKVCLNKEKAFPKFIYYQLKSPFIGKWLETISIGATMPSINTTLLGSIELSLPPLETQQKIAGILSAYDDLIENNRKQIKLLEEAAQKLYKEWFVRLNFPGHENVKIVDGVPEGWKKGSILSFSFFNQTNPYVSYFEGYKTYYATADVSGTFLDGDGVKITFNKRPSRASVQPCKNSVWFARMSNSYKILCCYGESEILATNSIISSGFAGFTSEEKYFGFIYTTIASDNFDKQKNMFATGATQVSLTNEGLKRIQILVPTEELIIKFSSITNSFIKKMEILKHKNKQLQSARDKLLPKLMNGELEV